MMKSFSFDQGQDRFENFLNSFDTKSLLRLSLNLILIENETQSQYLIQTQTTHEKNNS